MLVLPIVARPPTSAVVGRNETPARRTIGLLFMLAALTRALRPTVSVAVVKLSRADVVVMAPAERERATDVPDVRATDDAFSVGIASIVFFKLIVRAPLRTIDVALLLLSDVIGCRVTARVVFCAARFVSVAFVRGDAFCVDCDVPTLVADGSTREIDPSANAVGAYNAINIKTNNCFFI